MFFISNIVLAQHKIDENFKKEAQQNLNVLCQGGRSQAIARAIADVIKKTPEGEYINLGQVHNAIMSAKVNGVEEKNQPSNHYRVSNTSKKIGKTFFVEMSYESLGYKNYFRNLKFIFERNTQTRKIKLKEIKGC